MLNILNFILRGAQQRCQFRVLPTTGKTCSEQSQPQARADCCLQFRGPVFLDINISGVMMVLSSLGVGTRANALMRSKVARLDPKALNLGCP